MLRSKWALLVLAPLQLGNGNDKAILVVKII